VTFIYQQFFQSLPRRYIQFARYLQKLVTST